MSSSSQVEFVESGFERTTNHRVKQSTIGYYRPLKVDSGSRRSGTTGRDQGTGRVDAPSYKRKSPCDHPLVILKNGALLAECLMDQGYYYRVLFAARDNLALSESTGNPKYKDAAVEDLKSNLRKAGEF